MEQNINLRRLAMLFSLFWAENRKALLLLLLAVGSFLAVWLSVYTAFRNPILFSERFQIAYYFVGLFLSGCLCANFLFADLRDKAKSIAYLLIPASAFEKLLSTLLYGVVVYFFGYTLIFYLVDPVFVKLCNAINGTQWTVVNIFQMDAFKDPFFEGNPYYLFFLYFTLQAFFIAGSLYFNRYSFFKTLIVLLFVWIFLVFLPIPLITSSLPEGRLKGALTSYEVLDFKGNRLVAMPVWFSLSFRIFYTYILTLGFWITTYFLIKEKQIA